MKRVSSLRLALITTWVLGIQFWVCQDVIGQDNASDEAKTSINQLLNQYRQAAAKADGDAFFGCLDPNGVFFGTDEKERFTLDEFKAAFMPYFKKGIGWKRKVVDRQVYVAPGNQVGWFEEHSTRRGIGPMRSTGVVIKKGEEWKITQYNTSFTIPNEIVEEVAVLIEKAKEAAKAGADDS